MICLPILPCSALNSLAHTTRIVAYAFALVCILISGVVGVYVGAKVLHVGIYRNSESLTARTLKARLHWLSIIIFMWAAGFTLAELIPVRKKEPFMRLPPYFR